MDHPIRGREGRAGPSAPGITDQHHSLRRLVPARPQLPEVDAGRDAGPAVVQPVPVLPLRSGGELAAEQSRRGAAARIEDRQHRALTRGPCRETLVARFETGSPSGQGEMCAPLEPLSISSSCWGR
jgi:hypothetical protein